MKCSQCGVNRCKKEEGPMPKTCPMHDGALFEQADALLKAPENAALFRAAALVESEGYARWPRVREVFELMQKLSYTRLGLAFCTGLKQEAAVFTSMMEQHGLTVISCMCKMGARPKEDYGIKDQEKVRPGTFEVICNPIAQALYLNKQHTQYNVILGLCLGHDALFAKYAEAPTSTVVAKDRALATNPAGALYCRYCESMIHGA